MPRKRLTGFVQEGRLERNCATWKVDETETRETCEKESKGVAITEAASGSGGCSARARSTGEIRGAAEEEFPLKSWENFGRRVN